MLFENRTDEVQRSTHKIFSSKCRNKRLICYSRWRHSFDRSLRNDLKTYVNIKEIAADEGDDFATGCVLDYRYFNGYYQLTAVDLTK